MNRKSVTRIGIVASCLAILLVLAAIFHASDAKSAPQKTPAGIQQPALGPAPQAPSVAPAPPAAPLATAPTTAAPSNPPAAGSQLSSATTGAAKIPKTPVPTSGLMIEDGPSLKSFQLALDEIWVADADGKGSVQSVRASSAAELEDIVLARGDRASAIVYPEGQPRNEFTRRLVTNQITAKIASTVEPSQLAAALGVEAVERPSYAPDYVVLKTDGGLDPIRVARAMQSFSGVVSAEPQLARLQAKRAMPDDPLVSKQWHLKFANQAGAVDGTDIHVEDVWNYPGSGIRGNGVRIGIVDDGLQVSHPDLAPNVDTVNDRDWNGKDSDPSPGAGDDHGTACAGNAAARGNNGLGVSGSAPEATLVGLRLIAGPTTDAMEGDAMTYLQNIIPIKSNSWGPGDSGKSLEGPGVLMQAALKSATETGRNGLGTIFMWAAGNGGDVQDNSNYDGYANSIYVNAIAAFDSQSQQSYYSEPGANLVVTSPSSGEDPALGITTTDRTGANGYNSGTTPGELPDANYTQTFGGTSSATPTAAGVVALMLQANPNLGWRDVKEILIATATKVNPTDTDWQTNGGGFHFNHKFGAGLIDATAAVDMAATFPNLGPMKSATVVSPGTTAIPDNSAAGITRNITFTSTPVSRVEQVTVKLTVTNVPKGQLEVTLTSPSGTVSRLCEQGTDTSTRITGWTFMTVRNWGENPAGTWTLKVADRKSGSTGSLTAAEVTIYGAGDVTVNPPPSVTITSPTAGQLLTPNAPVTVSASATDRNSSGGIGTISKVEFFSGNLLIDTATSSPYSVSWTPSPGSYVLTAVATDSEGGTKTSAPVNVQADYPSVDVLADPFTGLTAGSNLATIPNVAWNGNANFPTVSNVFQARGAVRLGSSNNPGWITSRPLNLSQNGGAFTVKFDVKGWTGVEGNIVVSTSPTNFQTVTYSAKMSEPFETKRVSFTGGTANTRVTIRTTTKRAFIDNVSISRPLTPP